MTVRATTGSLCILVILLLTVAMSLQGSDDPFPKGYFRSPLGIPLVLAGNFAEMRDNHFHGGLDIKTNDAEGYRIYASADGYISRVKVSPFGYGHALYVAHPNGYTTVYAHASQFKGRIAGYVRGLQLARKTFSIDQYLKANQFPVKKGDVIALSGNTGSSSGPHLHFEIRKTRGQVPLNPLLFGFPIVDTKPPRIFKVRLYPMDGSSGVRVTKNDGSQVAVGKSDHVTVDAVTGDGGITLDARGIEAWGQIGIGIQTHDYHDGSGNRLGAYRISLTGSGTLVFRSTMESVSFGDMRFINAHVDYAERQQARRWIQRSYVLPGNALPIYETKDGGVVRFEEGKVTDLRYLVEDANENTATLSFRVAGVRPPDTATTALDAAGGSKVKGTNGSATNGAAHFGTTNGSHSSSSLARQIHVKFANPLILQDVGVEASFPAKAFYDDFDFDYARESALPETYSVVHVLHNSNVPVHRSYDLSITPERLPAELRPKSLIVSVDENGKFSSAGGKYETGVVKTRTRTLGKFSVAVDTTAPSIRSLDIEEKGRLGNRSTVRFIIDDDLSGISRYDGYIDGNWVLFSYDAKKKIIRHDLDPNIASGSHRLSIEVEDRKENVQRIDLEFVK